MCNTNNRKINRLHERCLRVIYSDKQPSFSELLQKDDSISIHMRNIQSLVIEMFHFSRNILPPIMNDIFDQKDNSRHSLRQISEFSRTLVKSVCHGSEDVSFLGPKIWDMLPSHYKDIDNSNTFKNNIKKWKPENYPCPFFFLQATRVRHQPLKLLTFSKFRVSELLNGCLVV